MVRLRHEGTNPPRSEQLNLISFLIVFLFWFISLLNKHCNNVIFTFSEKTRNPSEFPKQSSYFTLMILTIFFLLGVRTRELHVAWRHHSLPLPASRDMTSHYRQIQKQIAHTSAILWVPWFQNKYWSLPVFSDTRFLFFCNFSWFFGLDFYTFFLFRIRHARWRGFVISRPPLLKGVCPICRNAESWSQ